VYTCKWCGKTWEKPKKNSYNLYCNNACQGNYRTHDNIKSGHTGHNGNIAKRWLEKTDNRCSICGITEWNGKPIVFILDHIDGNSDNNSIDNLRLVCSNCDSQLPTYKNKNKGKGRHSRKQRYKDGKSY